MDSIWQNQTEWCAGSAPQQQVLVKGVIHVYRFDFLSESYFHWLLNVTSFGTHQIIKTIWKQWRKRNDELSSLAEFRHNISFEPLRTETSSRLSFTIWDSDRLTHRKRPQRL